LPHVFTSPQPTIHIGSSRLEDRTSGGGGGGGRVNGIRGRCWGSPGWSVIAGAAVVRSTMARGDHQDDDDDFMELPP
uniref:Uncharacterized protein n=1 Tax=Triticum urartu TaxID=4572 RepID=A0A8R7TXA3_TRIUA